MSPRGGGGGGVGVSSDRCIISGFAFENQRGVVRQERLDLKSHHRSYPVSNSFYPQ